MIILILVIGLILRLINLNQSLWLDEAISTLAARDYSYYGIAFDFLKIDNHSPGFYLLLKLWGETFGFTDWILRILPVLLGVGLIFITYRIASTLSKDSKLPLIAALLISTSPLLIYYSQEIRMYILITLLAALQVYVFQNLIFKQTNYKWIAFSLINCLLFFTDYITVFLFPIFFIYPLIKKDYKVLTKVFLSFIPLGILFILWFPMFNEQLLKNKEIVSSFPGWQYIVGGATLKNLAVIWMKFILGRISFEPKIIYYCLIAAGSIPVLSSLSMASKSLRKHLIIWLWLIVPVVLGFTFSFVLPVFNYFRFIYVLPAMLILVALGISQIQSSKIKNLLICTILLTNLIGLLIYYLDPAQSRENWKQAVARIEETAAPTDLVVFEFYDAVAPYRWYSNNKVDVIGATDSYFANREKTYQKLEPKLENKTRIYHFEYLRDLTDPERVVEQKLTEEGFKKGEILTNFHNIGHVSIWNK